MKEIETVSFEECVEQAKKPEISKKNYSIVLRHYQFKKYEATELYPGKGKNDFIGEKIDGTTETFEFKNYGKGNRNCNLICLELKNSGKKGYDGWPFDIQADHVIFIWPGKIKDCYIIVKGKGLENFWKENYKNYREILNRVSIDKFGNTWQSSFSYVPIKDLPEEIIEHKVLFTDLDNFW